MKLRLLPAFLVACGILLSVQHAKAEPQAEPRAVQLRPAVTVLLETLHNQSRAEGREGSANFGVGKLKEVLEKSGAEVSNTLSLLNTVPAPQRRLNLDLLSRFDVVISNGRYPLASTPIIELFYKEEVEALDEYMKQGGILFITCAGATLGFGCEPPLYNPMLQNFGVQVAFDDIKGAPEVQAVKNMKHPLMEGLPALRPMFPTSLVVTNQEAKILYKLDGRPMMVLIPRGKGALIVAGGGSGWMNQGIEMNASSCTEPQKKFLKNLVEWVGRKDAMGLPK